MDAGIKDPWDNALVDVMAAGDDVVIFCDPSLVNAIEASILRNSSRTKGSLAQPVLSGLGQCVKTVLVTPWSDFDFCSKWSVGSHTGDFDTVRDVDKLLYTKLYYSKQNQHILRNPCLHAKAIYDGFSTEGVSHLIEDILYWRLRRLELAYGSVNYEEFDLSTVSDRFKVCYTDEDKYKIENVINEKVGVDLVSLFSVYNDYILNVAFGNV